jgi:hypothetical protein
VRKILAIFPIILFAVAINACSKKPTPPTPAPNEAQIVFTINPDPGTTTLSVLGATQNIAITITSTMPSQGVTADISVKKDSDNSTVFSQTLSMSTASANVSIQNLTVGDVCTATITLTSKAVATNKATKTFKLARKS